MMACPRPREKPTVPSGPVGERRQGLALRETRGEAVAALSSCLVLQDGLSARKGLMRAGPPRGCRELGEARAEPAAVDTPLAPLRGERRQVEGSALLHRDRCSVARHGEADREADREAVREAPRDDPVSSAEEAGVVAPSLRARRRRLRFFSPSLRDFGLR